MFFWVRYPSSAVLKMYFPDIKFNKNNTAQLVKWFSNFRWVFELFFFYRLRRLRNHDRSEYGTRLLHKEKSTYLLHDDREVFREFWFKSSNDEYMPTSKWNGNALLVEPLHACKLRGKRSIRVSAVLNCRKIRCMIIMKFIIYRVDNMWNTDKSFHKSLAGISYCCLFKQMDLKW